MRVVALGDVATIERNGVDPHSLAGETPYLGLEHIERGGRIIGVATLASAEVASTKFRFGPEHVLFGKLRPYLAKISTPNFVGVCSTDILPIRPGGDLDRGYLAHFLRRPEIVAVVAAQATGANLPRLSPSALAQLEVHLFPLSEQQRIAAILDQADALRAKHRQVLAHLDALAEAVFEDTARTARSIAFGEVIGDGPTNGLYRPAADYGSGTQILRIDSFEPGRLGTGELKRVEITPVERAKYGLRIGDLVLNRVNALTHLGKAVVIDRLDEPCVYESNMMRIRLDSDRILSTYANYWLKSRSARWQILGCAKKSINQASINSGDVRSLQVPLPSPAAQEHFVSFVRGAEARHEEVGSALGRTDQLFSSLQSRAFSGRL